MEWIGKAIDLFLHLDKHLGEIIQQYGGWTYAILTLVVFCETGLVVTPFLPGDSLLFAAGALAALPASPLQVGVLFVLLTFAAVLGGSADLAIGDATMAQISRENGGPGVVVGTVVQRAHYFGVSKTLQPITDPKGFKGLRIVTSPEPNTNYSVAKRLLEKAGLKVGVDATIVPVNPGTEIAAMLAGQADIAIAYQPSVAAAEAQGAKVVFDFSSYIGPFCNTGIMVLPSTIQKDPEMVQALVTSFEEASRLTYADPDFAKEVARKEFPDLPPEVVDAAIDAQLEYLIPAQSVVVKEDQWQNLIDMQIYLGNVKGEVPFDEIIDNSFAENAVKQLDG